MSITTLTPLTAKGAARRTAAMQGLLELHAFLEEHPEMPLGGPVSVSPYEVLVFGGTAAENRREVDRLAAILGVTAKESHPGCRQYAATRDFGGLEFRVLTMTPKPISPTEPLPADVLGAIGGQAASAVPGGRAA